MISTNTAHWHAGGPIPSYALFSRNLQLWLETLPIGSSTRIVDSIRPIVGKSKPHIAVGGRWGRRYPNETISGRMQTMRCTRYEGQDVHRWGYDSPRYDQLMQCNMTYCGNALEQLNHFARADASCCARQRSSRLLCLPRWFFSPLHVLRNPPRIYDFYLGYVKSKVVHNSLFLFRAISAPTCQLFALAKSLSLAPNI